MIKTKYSVIFILIIAVCIVTASTLNRTSSAVTAAEWRAGNIISDSLFTDKNSMSVDQVQAFLNSKVGTGSNGRIAGQCDTYGVATSELGGGTRAQYGAAHDNPIPFTCLKDFYEVPKTEPGPNLPDNNYGKAIPAGAKSAAQLIWDAAQRYNISPKVLLVKLGTESAGPLTSDDWPFLNQYTYAMGSHCPDSGPGGSANCDTDYAGFSIQMYSSASLLRWYLDSMTQPWWSYKKPYQNNSILWNVVERGCGAANVYIENKATAALYTYTPYQPNQAALNNMYGTGDSCSAYGNRNFWRTYSDWFGPTQGGDPVSTEIRLTSPITITPAQPMPGQSATISYTVHNFSGQSFTYDNSVVQCRLNALSNCDFGYEGSISIDAGASRTFTYTLTVGQGGLYSYVPFFLKGGIWYRYGNEGIDTNNLQIKIQDMRIITPVTFSPPNASIGQTVAVSFLVVNYSSLPVSYQTSVLQCRVNVSTSCDSNYGGSVTLYPGQKLPVVYYLTPPAGGNYTFIPYYMENGKWYQYNSIDAVANRLDINIADLRLTTPIYISNAKPIPGQSSTVSYTVQNFGTVAAIFQDSVLQCRVNGVINCDPAYSGALTINAGESRTFTHTITASSAGQYTFTPYFLQNGIWRKYIKEAYSNNTLTIDVPAYVANMQLTTPIHISPTQPTRGQSATITYTVKNLGDLPAIFQDSVLQCRVNGVINCDPAYSGALTINAGESRTFTHTITASSAGQYTFTPYFLQNGIWRKYIKELYSNNTLTVTVP